MFDSISPEPQSTCAAPRLRAISGGETLLRKSIDRPPLTTMRGGTATASQAAQFGPALLPIEGPIELWNWSNPWAPSHWDKDIYPFKADNVCLVQGALVLSVVHGGGAGVQTREADKSAHARFEIEATLGPGRSGLIQSPLYLFGDDGHEIDFEIVGTRGLQLAIHTSERFNAFIRFVPGDFSGRHRFAIEYQAGTQVVWFVDGREVSRATPPDTGGYFPHHPLKPFAEIWPSSSEEWAGPWQTAEAVMILHGYRRTPL